jgi:hypothetical protein
MKFFDILSNGKNLSFVLENSVILEINGFQGIKLKKIPKKK